MSNAHTAGPFLSQPIPNPQCFHLGVVPKIDGTWRIIMDLSSPHGSSINDFIAKDDYTLHYAFFDEALTLVARYGQGALMAKLDIKDAFRLCPVCLEDRELLGIHWQGKFYILRPVSSVGRAPGELGEVVSSNPGRTNTQGLKITEKKVLSL